MICYSAQWADSDDVLFDSEFESDHYTMLEKLHVLMSEADAIVHYNGNKFDIPVINRESLRYSLPPPTPSKNIDLLQVVKKRFRFVSNKLDHVSQELGLGEKVATGGHELWLACMAGAPDAWEKMEEYNKQDVALLVALYNRLLPWIDNHPNRSLYSGVDGVLCTNCGSVHVHKRGTATTRTQTYQRYQCTECGTWMRGRKTTVSPEKRGTVLIQEPSQ